METAFAECTNELTAWNPDIAARNTAARAIALDAVTQGPVTASSYVRGASVDEAIQRTASWIGGDRHAAIYGSRINNPTLSALEDALAAYEEGTKAACVTSCGERAVVEAIAGSVVKGEHIVASKHLFGGTVSFLSTEMRDCFGVEVTYVDGRDRSDWANAVRDNTRIFLLETPTNPRLHLIDIEAVAEVARGKNILLIVDESMATALPQKAFRLGAHIVVESLTKTLSNGHGNAGIVKISDEGALILHRHDLERGGPVRNDPDKNKYRIISNLMRADSLSAGTAYHMLEKIAGRRAIFGRGTHTAAGNAVGKKPVDFVPVPDYAETFRRYSDTARDLAAHLSDNGFRILYPGLEDDPRDVRRHQQFGLAQHQMLKRGDGAIIGGGVFGVDFGDSPASETQAKSTINILIAYGWSPETNFAQPVPNATLQRPITFGAFSDAQCEENGITRGLVRFSPGLVDAGYSRAALDDALGIKRLTPERRGRFIAAHREQAFSNLGFY